MVERFCKHCNSVLIRKPSDRKTQFLSKKFCSRSCNAKYTTQNNPRWPGFRMAHGYKLLRLPDHPMANSDGYYAEHRLIVEKHLGRVLSRGEVVHHKNHIRSDNHLGNLSLLSSNKEHRGVHHNDLLEIMTEYWTPERREEQSLRVITLRRKKFWSSRKK